MVKSIISSNPFTPRSGQEPKVFLGRDNELDVYEKKLSLSQSNRYEHFIVTGGWGSGKTTLLKEFKKKAQSRKILTSFISVYEFTDKNLLAPAVHLITGIPRNLPIKFERLKKFGKYLNGVGITLPVIGGGVEFKEKGKLEGDPQNLLLESLLQLWKELKEETDLLVVLLDDVQNYKAVPEFIGILKNVLSDEEIINKTGYLFTLASTHAGWKDFLSRNHPIGRYFIPPLHLNPFTKKDTFDIVTGSLKNTGVTFTDDVKEIIYEYSEGHPFQLQIFCSYLFENQIIGKVTKEQIHTSLTQTLNELSPILLDPLYSLASHQEKSVLKAMSYNYKVYTLNEIIKLLNYKFSKGPMSAILSRLSEKGLLTKQSRNSYKIINKLFNQFIYGL